MIRLCTAFTAAVSLIFSSIGGNVQAETAFPKYSPLQQFETSSLSGERELSLDFGTPLAMLQEEPGAVRVRLPDGDETWIRRSDVFLSPDGLVIVGGAGFRTKERPKLWFWQSHATLTEFLSRASGAATDADFEEVLVRTPAFSPVFPVVASDVASVLGQKSERIASVLLPVHNETSKALARLSGSAHSSFDIHFLVDVSGDALQFTQVTLATLAQDLSRRLKDDPNEYRVSVTYFGNNVARGFRSDAAVGWAELGSKPTFAADTSGRWQEPILKGLADAIPGKREGRTRAVLVILSGADIQMNETSEKLGGSVTVATMTPMVPEDVRIIVAQVTPEPSDGLGQLAKRLETFANVEYLPFESGLGRTLVGRIQSALGVGDDRRIEAGEMGPICDAAAAAGLICFLPYAATTADRLPAPPVASRDLDWYSTIAWLVVEGLNLEFQKGLID